MSSPAMLEPLLAPVAAIQRVIEKLDDRGVIIGGVAASLLGEPRLTADADALLLISIDEVPMLIELAQAEGLHPRYADIVDFAASQPALFCSDTGRAASTWTSL